MWSESHLFFEVGFVPLVPLVFVVLNGAPLTNRRVFADLKPRTPDAARTDVGGNVWRSYRLG